MSKEKKTQAAFADVPIMDAEAIRRALRRIAHEIIERNPDLRSVVLAGIPLRGSEIARRIAEFIREIDKIDIDIGVIDVAMHRDDVGTRPELPVVHASTLPTPLEGRTLIIVDDVLFTGRTVRAAMDAISSFGRPARIQLAALIDRGHRELPIRADYVGKNLPTAAHEKIRVRLAQTDGEPDAVWLEKE
jgi:pyrimidine operon attenuation protein / uracil phosphoribosyltransferase